MKELNGIPLEFLHGVDNDDNTVQLVADVLRGYDNDTIDNIDTLVNGYDLAGFQGDGSVEDSEKLRSYLVRTKIVADKYPQSIRDYQNPQDFSKMLGYVLQHWDTANREAALDAMVAEEERLIGLGAIKVNLADDADDVDLVGVDEPIDYDEYEEIGTVATTAGVKRAIKVKKNKTGFFRNIKKLNNNANISKDANEVVNSNPYLNKIKNNLRKKIAESRKAKKSLVTDKATKQSKVITQNVATAVSGLDGFDDDVQSVLLGLDFYENLNGVDGDSIKNYLQSTTRAVERNSDELFATRNNEDVTVGALEYASLNLGTPAFDVVISQLSGDGMNDDEYYDFMQGLGAMKRQGRIRSFFKALKKSKKDGGKSLPTAAKINPLVKPVNNNAAVKKAVIKRTLNGVGLGSTDDTKQLLANTLAIVNENPALYVEDTDELENVRGLLGYAINNWDNADAVEKLCGTGMNYEQYENFADSLGAAVAKIALPVKKARKASLKKTKKLSAMKAALQKAAKNTTLKAKLAQRIAEAEKHSLGKKFFKKVGNAVKKAAKKTGSAIKTAAKKTGNAVKTAAKKTGKAVATAAKKTAQAVKKAVKKIVKFVVKYNPVTLVARAIILMACSLNMFKMAERMYPGTMSESDAAKLGLSSEQYKASKDAYDKLVKSFTKIGGKESKLKKNLEKGSKKVWKGSDELSVKELTAAALKNKKSIDSEYNQDEAELKKAGATSSNDPNVTYSETREEVEVAVEGVLGLIENGYIVNGLGVVTEATVASGAASAGGILAKILGGLKKVFASGKIKNAVKNTVQKIKDNRQAKIASGEKVPLKNRIQNFKENRQAKIASGEKTPLKERVKNFTSNAKDTVKNIASSQAAQNIKETGKALVTTAVANMSQRYSGGDATQGNNEQADNSATKDNTKLILGIGIGAAVLISGAILLTRNKDN